MKNTKILMVELKQKSPLNRESLAIFCKFLSLRHLEILPDRTTALVEGNRVQ